MLRILLARYARSLPGSTPAAAVGAALLVSLLVGAVYWPARENGFVWDDWLPLVDTPIFRDPARWWDALWTPPLNVPVAIRPVAMLSFMLQLWAGQTTPAPFHVANLVIHAASTFLLVLLAWRILREAAPGRAAIMAATLSGLVYGLHPALTEPVVWISCRYDLLMAFFLLLALLLDRNLPEPGNLRAIAVGAAFLAAALSKETAVGFALGLPFFHLALEQLRAPTSRSGRPLLRGLYRHWKVYVAVVCAGLFYLAARAAVAGTTLGMDRMAAQFGDVGSAGQRVLAVAASLGTLALDAVWPFKAAVPSRSLMLPLHWSDAVTVAPFVLATLFAAALWARSRAHARAHLILIVAFVAALLPVINLFPLPGLYGELWAASRYLTFPLVFLCLAAPFGCIMIERWMAPHIRRARTLLLLVALVWIAASAAVVRATIPLWKDDGTLNAWAIENGARGYWRYQNLGDYYLKAGQVELARKAFLSAVHLRGDIGQNWYYLGFAEAALGNTEAARDALGSALKLNPDLINARLTLAKLELGQGNAALAAELLEQGADRLAYADDQSQIGTFHYLLGITYAKLGMTEAATARLKVALERARDSAERRSAEAALRSVGSAGK